MYEKLPQINLQDPDKYALVGGLFGIIDSAMDAIVTINEDQRILLMNPAAEAMFGCKAAEMLGSKVDRFIPERFREAHEEHIRKFGETGVTSRRMGELGEIRGLRTNGEEFPIEASISQVRVGGTKLFSVILRDITERKRAEEALKESQRREQSRRIELETLMETVPVPVWVSYDRDCRMMTGNKAAYELTNLPIGVNISETAPNGKPHFAAYKDGLLVASEDLPMQKAARTGNATFNEELEFRFFDGRSKWVYGNAVPLRDENDNIRGAIGAFVDVTQRKQMEMAIEISERKFRAIFEQAPLGIALINAKTGQFLQVNQKYCDVVGRIQEDVLKLDFQTITHPDDLQADLHNMELLRENKIPFFSMEKRYIRPDTALIWVNLTVVPMWKEGEPTGIHIAMVTDITERKKIEEELRASERRFRKTFENAAVGITHLDLNGNWILVNDRFCEMLGYSREALTNTEFSIITHPDDIEHDWKQYRKLIKGEVDNYLIEKRYLHKNGSIVWASLYRSLVRDQAGNPLYSTTVVVDVTDRKKAEEEMRNLTVRLDEKNKEMESILGIVSHDLRSPLVNVKGFVNEIRNDFALVKSAIEKEPSCEQILSRLASVFYESVPESVNFIESSATAMENLVNALVEVARAGIAAVNPEIINMNDTMRQIVSSIKFKFKEADVTFDIRTNLPSCFADKTQVAQIFTNLLDNAVKYLDPSRRGEICIEGCLQGTYVIYWVADNGIGIADENQDILFNVYTQLHEKAAGGVGMGLATVKRLIDRNNGKIWVISERGKGSTFYILLPTPLPPPMRDMDSPH